MGMTFFNRRPELSNLIVKYFVENNMQSFCSAACSYGAEVYDFIFKLIEQGGYSPELKIVGCDIRKDIIQSLNMQEYKYCIIDGMEIDWSDKLYYPYPIMKSVDKILYKKYFNESNTIKQEFSEIPKFFVQDINDKFNEKYDMVVAFAILTHLCNKPTIPFHGKKDRSHIFNILNNLVQATNKILILGCPLMTRYSNAAPVIDMTRIFLEEYLLENKLQYELINRKFYFIYPNGIPKGI